MGCLGGWIEMPWHYLRQIVQRDSFPWPSGSCKRSNPGKFVILLLVAFFSSKFRADIGMNAAAIGSRVWATPTLFYLFFLFGIFFLLFLGPSRWRLTIAGRDEGQFFPLKIRFRNWNDLSYTNL